MRDHELSGEDRVREATPPKINEEIDERTEAKVRRYSSADGSSIKERMKELDEEWDVERALELNASVLALSGVILAATVNRKWLILPGIVSTFLLQHAVQGWCPPLPVLRKLGFRTQREIMKERLALQDLLS